MGLLLFYHDSVPPDAGFRWNYSPIFDDFPLEFGEVQSTTAVFAMRWGGREMASRGGKIG